MKRKYRPRTFNEVSGQEIPKTVLKAVAESPADMPQIYLLQGAWGTGKTTLSRVFAKAVNCKGKGKPCLECPSCLDSPDVLHDHRYQEYDAAMIGNVAQIKVLRESWSYAVGTDYRVITIDEAQTISREGQSALLNIFESPPPKTFLMLATTDPQSIIRPLVSRAFLLEFNPLTADEITEAVRVVANKEGIELTDKALNVIVRRANGHARDAISFLEMLKMLGEEGFLKASLMADSVFTDLFRSAVAGDKAGVKEAINQAAVIPLSVLNVDIERFIKRILDRVLIDDRPLLTVIDEQAVNKIFTLYIRASPILNKSTSDFCSFLNALASLLMKLNTGSQTVNRDRFAKK